MKVLKWVCAVIGPNIIYIYWKYLWSIVQFRYEEDWEAKDRNAHLYVDSYSSKWLKCFLYFSHSVIVLSTMYWNMSILYYWYAYTGTCSSIKIYRIYYWYSTLWLFDQRPGSFHTQTLFCLLASSCWSFPTGLFHQSL